MLALLMNQDFKNALWATANKLRGSVDPSDYNEPFPTLSGAEVAHGVEVPKQAFQKAHGIVMRSAWGFRHQAPEAL
jgi:hypothetical protein